MGLWSMGKPPKIDINAPDKLEAMRKLGPMPAWDDGRNLHRTTSESQRK